MTNSVVVVCAQCGKDFVPQVLRWWCKLGVQNGNKPLEACSEDCMLKWVRDDQTKNWKRR